MIGTIAEAVAGARPPVSYQKAVSGTLVAGRPHSFWLTAGVPGPGAAAANTAGGVVPTSATAGALTRANPAAGEAHVLGMTGIASAQAGTLMLCDRLLHIQGNSGGTAIDETLTTLQTINSTTLPSRCPTSAIDDTPSTNGFGVRMAVEVVSATGAGTPTLTLTYTNDQGTGSRTATNIDPTVASSIAGSFYRIGLQAGDTGVRSIQGYQQSATWTSGQLNLVLYRPLAMLPCIAAGVPYLGDWVSLGGPRVYNDACLFLVFIPSTTTTTSVGGLYTETNG